MTDHKYTDEEIIKALECCAEPLVRCEICPYKKVGDMCFDKAKIDALALINRQKAEIERLNKEVDRLSQCVLYHDGIVSDLERDLFNAKAEAIKEFAKRIKTDAERICDDNYIEGALIKYVDTLVKEMTEGKNESQSTKTVGGVIPARSGEA